MHTNNDNIEQAVGSIIESTPSVVLEIFNQKLDSIDYAEGELADVYTSMGESRDRGDNYALFAGSLKDGRTFNVRVFLDDCPDILRTQRDENEKRAYPQHDDLKLRFQKYMAEGHDSTTLQQIAASILETVGEYEHGTGDVENIERINLEQYIAVAEDLFLSMTASPKLMADFPTQIYQTRTARMKNRKKASVTLEQLHSMVAGVDPLVLPEYSDDGQHDGNVLLHNYEAIADMSGETPEVQETMAKDAARVVLLLQAAAALIAEADDVFHDAFDCR
jgi:hypothetical protein